MGAFRRGAGTALGLMLAFLAGGTTEPPPPRPAQCQGCHAMASAADSWKRGSHARATACGDCHLPSGSALRRGAAQAAHGTRHLAATLLEPAPTMIRLRAEGAALVEANCLRCHPRGAPKAPGRPAPTPRSSAHEDPGRACLDCHRETSHARAAAR